MKRNKRKIASIIIITSMIISIGINDMDIQGELIQEEDIKIIKIKVV